MPPGCLDHLDTDAKMHQFSSLQLQSTRYLAQGIKPICHGIEHHHQANPAVKTLRVALALHFAADLKNIRLVEQFNHLTIEQLSDKMCTFGHGYLFLVVKAK